MNTNPETFKFTYDEREICLLDSLPQVYHQIYDFKGMSNSSGKEISNLYAGVKTIIDDQFITTASSATIARWEKYLGITPNSADTLDERRFRILARLNDNPPYTNRYLINKLNELCGEGYYRISQDYGNYKLTIEISLDSIANTDSMIELIRTIVPANIELVIRTFRSRHYEVSKFTHTQLNEYTHDEIENIENLI